MINENLRKRQFPGKGMIKPRPIYNPYELIVKQAEWKAAKKQKSAARCLDYLNPGSAAAYLGNKPKTKFSVNDLLIEERYLNFLATAAPPAGMPRRYTPLNANVQKTINEKDKGCRIRFVNCGQGDAILLENAGETCLIDFGRGSRDSQQALSKALSEMGTKKINFAVLTHLHDDHAGMLADAKDEFGLLKKIDKILLTDDDSTTNFFSEVLLKLSERSPNQNRILQIGDTAEGGLSKHNFRVGNMTFDVLGPTAKHTADDAASTNNNSIVLKMTYKGRSVLFTGDIQREGESELITYCRENGIDLECDVMKLSHHGASNCNSENLLRQVKPKVCVASLSTDTDGSGMYNGHMDESIKARIQKSGAKLYRTDTGGDILVNISPEGRMNIQNGKEKMFAAQTRKYLQKSNQLAASF